MNVGVFGDCSRECRGRAYDLHDMRDNLRFWNLAPVLEDIVDVIWNAGECDSVFIRVVDGCESE